ncbi:hypothetical protein F5144DRAFT_595967 [Chaetomium tenue]|uniref:Uncharacterized protein n=1 Tax=Chaetomium tenue TaxID=1854479 RepID=A0ACB7P5E0_9PEZI|nr:hypothetical protein F5144DRAFT_595967 [Chaetomium globosum]
MVKKQTSLKPSQAELPPTKKQVPASPPSRKQQLDSDNDAEPRAKRARMTQPASEPVRLTRQNLARFNKMANNYKGSKKGSTYLDPSSSTKTLRTLASGFAVRARQNGILDDLGSKPPANYKAIQKRLARRRATDSPSESSYKDYARSKYTGKGYIRAFNQAFTGFPTDVRFSNGLSTPQPDFIENIECEEYRSFPITTYIPGAVLYEDKLYSVTLPHIAGEWKGPGGSIETTRLKAAYTGAALIFARNQALDVIKKPDLTGHAKVITFTTDGLGLNFFAHYAAETEGGALGYRQYRIRLDGLRYLRNVQDFAREESYALKDKIKEYWRQARNNLHPTAQGPLEATHVYEDQDD